MIVKIVKLGVLAALQMIVALVGLGMPFPIVIVGHVLVYIVWAYLAIIY